MCDEPSFCRTVFVWTLVVLIWSTANAQRPDSLIIKRIKERKATAERINDSLKAAFYSTPPFFKIRLEVNHETTTIPHTSHFFATNGDTTFEPTIIDGRYEFADLPDSVKFVLQNDSMIVSSDFVKKRHYQHGAYIRFGYFDNVAILHRKWKEGKKQEDFNEWTEIGNPYLDVIKSKKTVRAARRQIVKPVEFVSLAPREYGDGILITWIKVKLKK